MKFKIRLWKLNDELEAIMKEHEGKYVKLYEKFMYLSDFGRDLRRIQSNWNRMIDVITMTWSFIKCVVTTPAYEFDHSFIYILLRWSLSRVRYCIEHDGWSSKEVSRRKGKEIRTCERLINRILGQYESQIWDKYYEYEKSLGIDVDIFNSHNLSDKFNKNPELKKELHRCTEREAYLRKQDEAYLFSIIVKKGDNWWT